jgi:hypothetical protein
VQVVGPTAGCSTLVPEAWKDGVDSADFPSPGELAGDLEAKATAWRTFGVRQTGQLDKANGRTADAIGIVEACERRDANAVRQVMRPWWKVWGG